MCLEFIILMNVQQVWGSWVWVPISFLSFSKGRTLESWCTRIQSCVCVCVLDGGYSITLFLKPFSRESNHWKCSTCTSLDSNNYIYYFLSLHFNASRRTCNHGCEIFLTISLSSELWQWNFLDWIILISTLCAHVASAVLKLSKTNAVSFSSFVTRIQFVLWCCCALPVMIKLINWQEKNELILWKFCVSLETNYLMTLDAPGIWFRFNWIELQSTKPFQLNVDYF